ncbi:MAG: sigma-54 dependent transcriptional regulator [Thermodesulfobacteriota bacterium]|nr:sigma-54 dependent transcriptional regulator [Thermodesulfobacteriota bacterium]
MRPDRILIAEDEKIARENLEMILRRENYEVVAVANGSQALREMDASEFDLVLTDLNMPDVSGMQILEYSLNTRPDTEVLVITGFATVNSAVEAMQKGAFFYLPKPYKIDELRILVQKALEKRHLRREVTELRRRMADANVPHIIGNSPAVKALKETVHQIAFVDCNVLILGETGTGKELAARAIHYLSNRRDCRFLAVNCASFNEDLLGNELFGHEREAFTGAEKLKKGLIESADQGTFFLDEIGDMPLPMQAKLLRVLETKTVIRLGGTEEIPVDVRILAATNKNLKQEVEEGNFRQDLFYRLNVITLNVPALAERKEDIPLVGNFFLRHYAQRLERPAAAISDEAMDILLGYEFPGNVRELENIIERAVVLCNGETIQPAHLPEDLHRYESRLVRPSPDRLVSLKDNEREHIAWVIDQCGGNKTRAAEVLEVDRATLWRKIKRLGIKS